MALEQNYYSLWFESFRIKSTSGHKSEVQLRLVAGQDLPKEIIQECSTRSISPFSLLTECSKKLFTNYPVGAKFLLKAKLTDREGQGLFFYNYHGWKPFKIKA